MNKKATRLFSMLLAVLMVLAVMPVITLSAAVVDGTLEVRTPEDLFEWASDPASVSYIKLMNDIDMANHPWTPIETWGGTFDGNGYAIHNLTSTAQDVTTPWGAYHAKENMRGGIVNHALDGLTFKNVAFLNMTFITNANATLSHSGMLFGSYYDSVTVNVDGVVIMGKNAFKQGGDKAYLVCGMFGGRPKSLNAFANISNSVFICTDPENSAFAAGFAGGYRDSYGNAQGTINVSNTYIINPYMAVNGQYSGSNNANPRTVANNIYATGSQSLAYALITTSANFDTPLTFKSKGDAAFYAAIGDRDIVESDFYGSALPLGDGFTYADGLLPVPKCFEGSNVATILTHGEAPAPDYGKASDYLTSIGASIRLGSTPEKQGIRFMFETTEALALLAQNEDVTYGVLVAPTSLINGELDIEDEEALIYANMGDNVVTLDVVDGKFNAALVNFAGVAGDAFCVEFTVRGFVVVNDTVLYLDAYTASVTSVAKAYINVYGEDPEKADTIAKIEAMLGDHLTEA